MTTVQQRQRIAVIGGGVAGITAAHLLQERHDVTLFERNDYVGGHTHTVTIPSGPDTGMPVDTGFIVCNDHTYPMFFRLLDRLGATRQPSDMSFSCYNETSGLQYAGTGPGGLFARRRDLFRPAHWRFLLGIVRFCKRTRERLHAGTLAGLTLGRFCEEEQLAAAVIEDYVLPMASAIWSTPLTGIRDFPMQSIGDFYENHGLLSLENRPTWYCVKGGSSDYVRRFLAAFRGMVRTSAPVRSITRETAGVRVTLADNTDARFDSVVVAAHADEALGMLEDPSPEERALLGAWSYSRNRVVLHTDAGQMPPCRRAWASWNYLRLAGTRAEDPASLTYHMNRLQRLPSRTDYFVTLNPVRPIEPSAHIREFLYMHPVYDFRALASQAKLPSLNGVRRTFFCGSYFRHGFHEDAVMSGAAVAAHFGISL